MYVVVTNQNVVVGYMDFTARSSYVSAVLGIVILSVCTSDTSVLCGEMKEHIADIWTPHERVITLVYDAEIGGRCPLPPEICA